MQPAAYSCAVNNRIDDAEGDVRTNAGIRSGNWQLVLLLLGNVLFAAGLFVHAFLFNFYLREVQLPPSAMGHQVAAMTLGGLVALLPVGITIDRFGVRSTMLAGVALAFAVLVLTAVLSDPAMIYAAAFIIGLGGASCRVSWGPAIMRLATAAARSRAFTWNAALMIASGAVWVYLSGYLPELSGRISIGTALSGIQVALLLGAVVTAAAALCYGALKFPPEGHGAAVQPPRDAPPKRSEPLAVTLPVELRWVIACVAFWMLAAALVLPFFNIYFTDRFAMKVSSVGALFASAKVATALLLLVAAEMGRRWGPRRMLSVWMTLAAPALLGLALADGLPLAMVLFVVQGFVAPATNPLIDQLLLERAPPERHGMVASWRNAAAEGSGALGASVGGRVLEVAAYSTLFVAAAAIAAASALLLGASLRRRQRDMDAPALSVAEPV